MHARISAAFHECLRCAASRKLQPARCVKTKGDAQLRTVIWQRFIARVTGSRRLEPSNTASAARGGRYETVGNPPGHANYSPALRRT